jgi:hypothetical protein
VSRLTDGLPATADAIRLATVAQCRRILVAAHHQFQWRAVQCSATCSVPHVQATAGWLLDHAEDDMAIEAVRSAEPVQGESMAGCTASVDAEKAKRAIVAKYAFQPEAIAGHVRPLQKERKETQLKPAQVHSPPADVALFPALVALWDTHCAA